MDRDKDKRTIQIASSLVELMEKVEEYSPTWEDLVLELKPKEKQILGIEDKEEVNED